MKQIIELKNGNLAIVQSIRYVFNKCIFTFKIMQINGNWCSEHTESFTVGYYESVKEYIYQNY